MSSERQLLESESRWWGEHVHRYNEALMHISTSDIVLDIACGTGFGTDIIAAKTNGKVTGGDIANEAIEECRGKWEKNNLSFEVLDGTKMPYPDHYFDVIVSFETIEHTTEYLKMIVEFHRVLKPQGKLILSTPNSDITSPEGIIANPYHTQEFDYDELKEILKVSFSSVKLYGQRYSRYDKKSLRQSMAKIFEEILSGFGIRKLPIGWRNSIMKSFFGYPLYPREKDFVLEENADRVKAKCPVLFAVCQK